MDTQTKSNTGLSLTDSNGRQLLQATIKDYLSFVRKQPAICGSAEQQEALLKHIAQGHDLIKLVGSERLKITRQLDKEKHDWIELEKEMTAPIEAALKPLKEAIEHYNREIMRIRQHQLDEAADHTSAEATEPTNWLTPEVALVAIPKGVQMKWSFDIVDPNQVPNGYWIIDEGAIKADIANGVREIPGVRIYEQAVTTYRR